jgi:hypothetical protein
MRTHSFAKTPLNAAHAPLVIAKKSHADFVRGIDMVSFLVLFLRTLSDSGRCGGW